MRAAKWTLIILGSLLLLLVASVLVITSVIDPNSYRGKIESIVGERVGRPLVIGGDLKLTWFPWLGVHAGASHLANRSGDTGPPIIEWQSLSVAVRVLPLLHRQLVVGKIRLESPQVRLRRDVQGHGNWEDLLGSSGAQPSRGGSALSPGGAGAQIAGVEIRNGVLSYVDERSGLQINLSRLDFDMGEWRAEQPLPIHARFLANGASLPATGVWVEVDTPGLTVARGASGQPASTASQSSSERALTVAAPKLAVKVADAEIRGDVSYQQVEDGDAGAGQTLGQGRVTVAPGGAAGAGRVTAHGSLTAHAPSLRKLAGELGLDQTMPHDPTTLGELNLTASWSYDDGLLAARPLGIKLDGITLEGWVERSAAPRSEWKFQLHGDRIDLGRYVNVDSKQNKPFELDMLRAINANGSLSFDEAQLADTRMSDVRLRFETPETQP